jgi:hypothetical protein
MATEVQDVVVWGLCVPVAALAVREQLRAARLRARARLAGHGMVDDATGLATLPAAELGWGAELDVAAAHGTRVAVVALRTYTAPADDVGRALAAALREHEVGVRVDHDACAALVHVAGRDDAVLAAARLLDAVSTRLDAGDGAGASTGTSPDVGLALASTVRSDLLDVVDEALARLVPPARLREVARELRAASAPAD